MTERKRPHTPHTSDPAPQGPHAPAESAQHPDAANTSSDHEPATGAAHPVEDSSQVASPEQLLHQMTRQREIFQQIARHLPEQLQAAQQADDHRLGELMAQRRRLLGELGRIDQTLLPTRRFLSSRDPGAPWRSHPLTDVRPQVEALAADMLQIKARIQQCDSQCEQLLARQRKQNDQQRNRMQQGARAAAAYRQGAAQPGGLGFSSQSFFSGGTV